MSGDEVTKESRRQGEEELFLLEDLPKNRLLMDQKKSGKPPLTTVIQMPLVKRKLLKRMDATPRLNKVTQMKQPQMERVSKKYHDASRQRINQRYLRSMLTRVLAVALLRILLHLITAMLPPPQLQSATMAVMAVPTSQIAKRRNRF